MARVDAVVAGALVAAVEAVLGRSHVAVSRYVDRTNPATRRRHALVLALALAALTDVVPVLVAGFPLSLPISGGGLYYHMSTTIADGGFAYPETIPYYTPDGIPFAYPPLVFYAIAATAELTPLSIRTLHAYLPVVCSLATVPLFYLFATEFLEDDVTVALATLVYAVMGGLGSFVTGQGLVEVVGTLLYLGGLVATTRYAARGRTRWALAAGLLLALTTLSSPGGAFAFAVTLVVFAVFRGEIASRESANDGDADGDADATGTAGSRDGATPLGFAAIAAIGFVGSAPWWATVVSRHGVDTLLTGFLSRQEFLLQFLYTLQFDPLGTVFWGALAFLGLCYRIVRRELLVPAWFVCLLFAAETSYIQPIPGAVLVAVAVTGVVYPAMERVVSAAAGAGDRFLSTDGMARTVTVCFVALLLFHGLGYALVAAQTDTGDVSQLDGIPRATAGSDAAVAAMHAVRERTPPDSAFLVVAPDAGWHVSDWFPALAHRTAYVGYGTEWLGTGRFWALDGEVDTVRTAAGLRGVAREYDVSPTHVYVHRNAETRPLRTDLAATDCAERVVRTDAASVYNLTCG